MTSINAYEDILRQAGGFGRYQILVYFWQLLVTFMVAPIMSFMVFGKTPPHKVCTTAESSFTTEFPLTTLMSTVPDAPNTVDNCTLTGTFYSVVWHWHLIGPQEKIGALITSLQMVGVFIGPLVSGWLSDRIGRKPTFLLAYTGLIVSNLASTFCHTWQLYMVARLIIGIFVGGVMTVVPVLVTEVLMAKWRLVTYFLSSPLGYIWLGFLAKVTRHWQPLTLLITSTAPVTLVLTYWVYESPKWLLERGRYDEMQKVVTGIAKFNRVVLPKDEALLDQRVDLARQGITTYRKKTYWFWHLFYSAKSARYCVVLMFSWCVTSGVFYGLVFNTGHLSGDVAMNFIYMMTTRLVTNSCIPFLDHYIPMLGRRHMQRGGLAVLISCFCVVIGAQSITLGTPSTTLGEPSTTLGAPSTTLGEPSTTLASQFPMVVTVACICGIAATGYIWAGIQMYAMELFPTVLRNTGLGLCSSAARIGGVLAPQILLLRSKWKPLPFVVFAAVATINLVVACIFLPETKGRPLPDLVEPRSGPSTNDALLHTDDELNVLTKT